MKLKKLLSLALLFMGMALSCTLTACGDDEPSNPGSPNTPTYPNYPDTPDRPDTPDTPDTPDSPDTPDTPDTPEEHVSLLAGTNWSGTIDGDYVELSFKSNGTFVEIYAGDRSTSTYTELDDNTIIIGDGTVMSNIFGENPFHFELSSNKSTLTFSNNYDTWKFRRKA